MVATNVACKLFVLLACVVSFQITKPVNVEPSKNFRGYPEPRKYFDTKILQHENFQIYGMCFSITLKLTCFKAKCVCSSKLPYMDDLPCSLAARRVVACGDCEPGVSDPQLGLATTKG